MPKPKLKRVTRKRREKKLVERGAAHIRSSFNNTIVTITDLNGLLSQLAQVRTRGYAIDDEENEPGIRCVALAIPGPGGRADSAFSISGMAPYMTPDRVGRIAQLALETRADILHDLGLAGH